MLHQLTNLATFVGKFSDIEADLHVREPVRAGGLCWAGERVDLPLFLQRGVTKMAAVAEYDFFEQGREVMDSLGIVPPAEFVCDGRFHTCGTVGKERGTDGRYLIHYDNFPVGICINWRTDERATWTAKRERELTGKEKSAYRERVQRLKEQAHAEQTRKWEKTARTAEYVWSKCQQAQDTHPYLQRKKVPAYGLRLASGNRLVLPILSADGQFQSLNFISADGSKKFLAGGKTAGGHFPILAKDGTESGPLLIGEGFATTMSACISTGYAGLVAFNAGNLSHVAQEARLRYPERQIIILEDNDLERVAEIGRNPGQVAAEKAARIARAKIAHCPALQDKSTDFNDLYCALGPGEVKKVIEQSLSPDMEQGEQPALPRNFYYTGKHGDLEYRLYNEKGELKESSRICRHIEVLGYAHGEARWGWVLRWKDKRGVVKKQAIPSRLFQTSKTELAEYLADEGGLDIQPGQQKRFKEFVLGFENLPIYRNVSKIGWCDGNFVLPNEVIGKDAEKIILQPATNAIYDLYQTKGELKQWQEVVALCAGNSRFEFALAASFAGALLCCKPTVAGTIFHFAGMSSGGKTTALNLGASIWGDPNGQKRSWRLTDNALESLAPMYNDLTMYLDEIGEVEPVALRNSSYMLSDCIGKGRANREGGYRQPSTWRCIVLSTGETTFENKLREGGYRAHAGQRVRFVDIPVYPDHLTQLHGLPSAKCLVERLEEVQKHHYGQAGRAFLELLVADMERVREEMGKWMQDEENRLCPRGADPQVRRVAQRFALVSIGGCLAQEYKILPETLDILSAVKSCFEDWLAERGTIGADEDRQIAERMRSFIEANATSRFQDVNDPAQRINDRVGFRRICYRGNSEQMTEFLFFPSVLEKEVFPEYSLRRVLQVLDAQGWLKHKRGTRYTARIMIHGEGRKEYYCVVPPSLSDDEESD